MFQFLHEAWEKHRRPEHSDDDFGEFVKVFIEFLGIAEEDETR
jgi:hypothetical protein